MIPAASGEHLPSAGLWRNSELGEFLIEPKLVYLPSLKQPLKRVRVISFISVKTWRR